MAAHLRSNIRLYVTGNRFVSPSVSPLSGGGAKRPLMASGGRSLCSSSSSISASPNQVSKPPLALQVVTYSLMTGVWYTLFQCADVERSRSRNDRKKVALESEITLLAEADLEKFQRRIEEMKKRVDKNDNVAA